MRFSYRLYFSIALFLFFAGFVVSASAQSFLHNSDAAVSVFGQFTPTVSGNGITDATTSSVGGQAAFRHSYHWWLGFEGSYNYTRYAELYSSQHFPVQHNTHEFAASYLVAAPGLLGFHPFALAGISALVFSPSLNGGQNFSWQGEPAFNFGVGVNQALLSSHFGIRLQYRGVYYKAPDFNEAVLDTGKSRLTSEPMAGVFLKF
jgi:hypothetical protein